MQKLITIVVLTFIATASASAQNNYVELRGSTANYGYVDFSRNLSKTVVAEFTYLHVSGQEQVFAGLGHNFKLGDVGTTNVMIYGVVGSNNQLGLMLASIPNIQKGKFKANAFIGWFIPLKGEVKQYLVLDSGDATWAFHKKLDVGASTGFFLQEGRWNTKVGPMVRLNLDKLGSYAVSFRDGSGGRELRFTRTFIF